MEGTYYTPMYGGLMLPVIKRQGSDVFQIGSSMYATHRDIESESSSPLSAEGHPAMPGLSPYDTRGSLGFHMRPPKDHRSSRMGLHYLTSDGMDMSDPLTHVSTHDNSPGSFMDVDDIHDSDDTESSSGKSHDLGGVPESKKLPQKKSTAISYGELPVVKLGDDGRSKLKSALSERVREDMQVRRRVESIGKIRLASMQQLLAMAKEAGLWEFVVRLSEEHEQAKILRKSS
jgi:hypothetical protein